MTLREVAAYTVLPDSRGNLRTYCLASSPGQNPMCVIRCILPVVLDWKNARVIRAESNKYHRWIREAIEIRKRGPNSMNRDEGAYTLSHTWDSVLEKMPGSRCASSPYCLAKPCKQPTRHVTIPTSDASEEGYRK
ncbi:hypothetical protein WMY93_011868 [Mugilogobius chulae]|uniref:Uncharacterized protein n=1 Tax=Mugilogobius chulae TaxID=88201 RepID=A0AAW0P3A2_9GOBI